MRLFKRPRLLQAQVHPYVNKDRLLRRQVVDVIEDEPMHSKLGLSHAEEHSTLAAVEHSLDSHRVAAANPRMQHCDQHSDR